MLRNNHAIDRVSPYGPVYWGRKVKPKACPGPSKQYNVCTLFYSCILSISIVMMLYISLVDCFAVTQHLSV